MANIKGKTYQVNQEQHFNLEIEGKVDVNISELSKREGMTTPFILGKATDGSPTTIIDATKNFIVNSLANTIVKFRVNGVEYVRDIVSNDANSITFSPPLIGASGVAVVGESGSGQVTVTTALPGDEAYTIEVINGTGNNQPITATLTGLALVVTLATDGSGNPNNAVNTATAVANEIDSLPEFSATMTGMGGVMPTTSSPVPFTGGVNPVNVVAGVEYQIIGGVTDVNIRTVEIQDSLTGSINLASTLLIPATAGRKLAYGICTVQMRSTNISATTTFYLEFSLDGTNWDIAEEGGVDISSTLVQSVTKLLSFESTPGVYWRIRFSSGATGTVNYIILG